jgi:hypothetical protein
MQQNRETMKHRMIAIVCITVLALGTGCPHHKTTNASVITASAGGREIKATVDGPAWVKPAEDKITVKVTGHEFVIEKERLLIDGKEQAKIPATATKFDVALSNGTLRVTADGTEVLATSLVK